MLISNIFIRKVSKQHHQQYQFLDSVAINLCILEKIIVVRFRVHTLYPSKRH